MSKQTRKRKRSLQDSPVDVSKFQQALNTLQSLKEELDGITETEAEMEEVMNHVCALEEILKTAKKRKITFSTISAAELERLGIESGILEFHQSVRERLLNEAPPVFKDEMDALTGSLTLLGECVSMDYDVGARVFLDAILITLRKIALEIPKDIAILPEFSLTPTDGVQLVNNETGYEVTVTGSVDYAVIKYERNEDSASRLLTPEGFRPVQLVYDYAAGRLFLVAAKRQNGRTLISFLPEAVSQAYVVAKTANLSEVHFCLSDGKKWIFVIFRLEKEKPVYYVSIPQQLRTDSPGSILILLSEWLKPSPSQGLYTLKRLTR